MKDKCECKETFDLKVEAEIGADAIWCNKCYTNFEIQDIPISLELKEEHNKQGLKLTKKIQKELKNTYKVLFSPSTYAKYQSQ